MNGSAPPAPAQDSPASPMALDSLRFPLRGSRLIEASAGTGKTYTIAALYVRLILGHGGDNGYARALTPPEILVVTFTEAATQELRDRIRARLAEAAWSFLAEDEPAADGFLRELRAEYAREDWPACARKLQLAAGWMDEAAVSTIHAWCKRMLGEHAFDSGSLFDQTLETDRTELNAEAVRDYWRIFLAPLDLESAAEVLQWWPGPESLWADLDRLVDHVDLLPAVDEPAELLREARLARQQALAELKAPWAGWVEELRALLDGAREQKRYDGSKLKKNNYEAWLQALAQWRDEPGRISPGLSDAAKSRLTVEGLGEIWKDDSPPDHPALRQIAALDGELALLPDAREDLLRHGTRWVAERLDLELARRGRMGFDELLSRLDRALGGANGERLGELIRRQFPVALIDEFQDTDPLQFRIFDRVYGVAADDPDTALVLIGDPKQAIYAFRGADIYTYLAARRACSGRLHTLTKNYRSSLALVSAVNRCFGAAEARPAGAFRFRSARENPLPFLAAEAQGRCDELRVEGELVPALSFCCLPAGETGQPLGKDAYLARMAAVCAGEMVRLLRLGQAGRAGWPRGAGGSGLRELRPADLAVLVNNRREAEAIRTALAARGVRSVYLSERDSVYQSPQAGELQLWLAACAEPADGVLLRAALATPTLALDFSELDRLSRDDLAWEARLLQFRSFRDCWRRQGVLPMVRRLLHDFGVPARLLDEDGASRGERTLTDLLHLAELLQQASLQLDGEQALIRHLAEQRRSPGENAGGDARQLRLESDADLVQVITVHKSKGLEYPLVFLPFACAFRSVKAAELPLKWHDGEGRLRIALRPEEELLRLADEERLGEDLRKFYVALTRARYAAWVGVAPVKELERSALGHLLGGGESLPPAELEGKLREWGGGCEHWRVQPAPAVSHERYIPADSSSALGKARVSRRAVGERWWVASYSAMAVVGAQNQGVPDTPSQDVFGESLRAELAADELPRLTGPAGVGNLHGFPRGAEVGSFLHDLLEWSAVQGFASLAENPDSLKETLAQRCAPRGWSPWSEALSQWLAEFLGQPWRLPPVDAIAVSPFSLSGLTAYVPEMEFWLAVHSVDIQEVDRLVSGGTLGGAPRPALQAGQLNGMLKGFIDLVFQHQGRYYVADYKSNWLGVDDSAYTPSAMSAEVLHARYDLQYVLYLLALHRLLRSRLPGYRYEEHVGGAVYLFLRGSRSPWQGLHFERPPRELIEALDRLFSRQTDRSAS